MTVFSPDLSVDFQLRICSCFLLKQHQVSVFSVRFSCC